MKSNILQPFVVLLILAAGASTASAQMFGPTTAVTGDTSVLTAGTAVLGYDASSSVQTVNGVSFSGTKTQNGVTLAVTDGFVGTPGAKSLSTALLAVLGSQDGTANTSPVVLTLSGLTPNDYYELQVFSAYTNDSNGTETILDGSASGVLKYGTAAGSTNASYIDLTFQAPLNGKQTIDVGKGSGNYGLVNALDLRLVPEPSTLALVAAGVAGLGFLVRRKGARLTD